MDTSTAAISCWVRRTCAALLLLGLGACCSATLAVIPIRERNFRVCEPAETCRDPLPLPLTRDVRQRLERFLLAGGVNGDVRDGITRAPDAPTHYRNLLDALSRPGLRANQLLGRPYVDFFSAAPPVREVIDARGADAIAPGSEPYAVHDERYDWVFYPAPSDSAALAGVLVMRRYGVKPGG